MVRRIVGVAVGLGVIGALGFALGDRDEKVPPYPSTQALGREINAHGIRVRSCLPHPYVVLGGPRRCEL
jgi:hypothetical protein